MVIREAELSDVEQVWNIFHRVIQSGDTYVFDPDTPRQELNRLWFSPIMKTFVAVENDQIVGTYIIKPNQPDLGSHIANCSYMVHPSHQGKGIGSALCEHSLSTAKSLRYTALQFNIVVSTNRVAVRLWTKFGFRIIGTVPGAFRHLNKGYVDAYIMFKEL